MNTYQGKCLYCGNEQPIMAESQTIADETITNSCTCSGVNKARLTAKLTERINYIASGAADPAFSKLTDDQMEMLRQGGRDVMELNCNAVIFEFDSSKIKIANNGEKIKVTRTGTRKAVEEI